MLQIIRRTIDALPMIALAMAATLADQGLAQDCAGPACDPDCDIQQSRWDACCRNLACQRGTVGSLFRWSANPNISALPQLDEPIVTDRPDFTEASSVVGLGVLQLETGYTYTYDDDGGVRTIGHSYPETLFRYGVLANWLEFRLAWNYGDDDLSGASTAGADDLYLGFKVGLTPQDGWRPQMALIPQMTVPTGASSRTNGKVLPGANWIYGWDLTDCLSTAGSTQFNKSVDDVTGDTYTQWAQSAVVGWSITDRLGAYAEYFGLYPSGAATVLPEHYFNGGFTILVCNDIQWDIRGGTGLNSDADDYFVGTGVSIRFR